MSAHIDPLRHESQESTGTCARVDDSLAPVKDLE